MVRRRGMRKNQQLHSKLPVIGFFNTFTCKREDFLKLILPSLSEHHVSLSPCSGRSANYFWDRLSWNEIANDLVPISQ